MIDQMSATISLLAWGNRLALPVALGLLIWSYRRTGSRVTLLLAVGLGLWMLNWAIGLTFTYASPLLFPAQPGTPLQLSIPNPLSAAMTVTGQLARVAGAAVLAAGAVKAVEEWRQVGQGNRAGARG